jgi:16S rRNA (guanine966-N2)-methyltransferase
MLRIIAGKFRSRKLLQPPIEITRATKDRVREAVFSALGVQINAASVLDLFAGSGAYGLEAISRGARQVHFNDMNAKAIAILNQNMNLLKITNATVTQLDYLVCLGSLHQNQQTFDIIFLDPPYQSEALQKAVDFITEKQLLNPHGAVVIETEGKQLVLSAEVYLTKRYNYGRTTIEIGWKKV